MSPEMAAPVAPPQAGLRLVPLAPELARARAAILGWVAALRRRAASPPAMPRAVDADVARLRQVVRLYGLVLGTVPDRPGLRHHAELLASGSTLEELAASLLAVSEFAATGPDRAAQVLWSRAGGEVGRFTAAWRASEGLPALVAVLARQPPRDRVMPLAALFPAGIDARQDDVGPAWGYRLWAEEVDCRLDALVARSAPLLRLFGPVIVLTLVLSPDATAEALDATLAGLSRQRYGRWRLLLSGTPPPGWSVPPDPRVSRGGSPRAEHSFGARGVLLGTLQAGEVLSGTCLALFALAALRRPLASCWRCDEDVLDHDGGRVRPRLDRDAGLLLRRAGAVRQDRVLHLPAVLLHRSVPHTHVALDRHPGPATVGVSLVIATRDQPALLRRCIDSIRATTGALRPEIVLVDNGSTDPQALRILAACAAEGVVVLRRPEPFNWSALCNAGVRASSGEVVVLLNNDVECLRPGWLEMLAAACLDPAVGVAGARLLFADGRVQHAGVLVGPGPSAAHRLADLDQDGNGDRPVTAVTGACMAFRRAVFDRLGGLEERLPVTWNDIDFCLRAAGVGYAVRLVSDCVLQHHELGTREPDEAPSNRAQLTRTLAFVARRHRRVLQRDRFLHPLLLFHGGGRLLDPDAPAAIERLLRRGGVD